METQTRQPYGEPAPRDARERAPLAPRTEGICTNCAQRETCTFPRKPGGVWRCEEYA